MNIKRWVLSSLLILVTFFILDFISYGNLLAKMYAASASLWRPEIEMDAMLPYGYIGTLIVSFLLVYIYDRGYTGKGSHLAEGLRFGLVIGVFVAIPMAVWSYISLPMTLGLAIGWFITAFVKMLSAGFIVGVAYRK